MSTPQAKRRRLNQAAKTLQKPFKSPFRTPLRPGIGSDPPSSDPPEASIPDPTLMSVVPSQSAENAKHLPTTFRQGQTPVKPVPVQARVPRPLPSRSNLSASSRTLLKKSATKPALTREIMQLRNEMQILLQAHTLATSTKDDDLELLIDKWRTTSRTVAEELFATTRDKVNRMGGVGAWKAREQEGQERQRQWDKEEIEAQREKMEEARNSGEIEDEAYDRYEDMVNENGFEEKDVETFKVADDDSFTMDMMLKTLNIDLQLIGYNKVAQRWDG